MEVGSAPAASSSSLETQALKANLKVFKTEWDFMECCNLFIMYSTTLGLASALTLTSFYEY